MDVTQNEYTRVVALDQPGNGGAHHKYVVLPTHSEIATKGVLTAVDFQNGPIKENGVNGCQIEDLLAISGHRLECFQEGPFACDANAKALHHIEQAISILNARTADRKARGVEGLSKV